MPGPTPETKFNREIHMGKYKEDWSWKPTEKDINRLEKPKPSKGLRKELVKKYIPAVLEVRYQRELARHGIEYKEKGWRKEALKLFGLKIDKSTDYHSKRNGKGFYSTWEWKKVRFEVIKKYGPKCMCCGSDYRIVVDHIKPRSKFPELALDLNNLQVLCNDCNMGKSDDDFTDFRSGYDDIRNLSEYSELEHLADISHLH